MQSDADHHSLALLAAVFFFSGCAALPLDSSTIPHPSSRSGLEFRADYREAVGVIHIHSTYSDGSRPIEEIAEIANRQELDFLIFTDHDTLQGRRDGKEGWYGKTLALIDEEISTKGGHYLALGVDREVPRLQDPQGTIEAVSAQGGLGFVAHPLWPRRPWKNLGARGMTGLEIYSGVADVTEENLLWMGFWTIFAGSEFTILEWLDRPAGSLALWDRWLAAGEPVVGIGSPDAHGLRRFGLRLGPYAAVFRLVRNHLWVRELSKEGIHEALASGRLFVAHDLVADAAGFQFLAVREQSVAAVSGQRVKLAPGLKLYAYLPSPGKIFLMKDGARVAAAEGQHLWFEAAAPGVYRVEAAKGGKPWIYSNPIYVLE